MGGKRPSEVYTKRQQRGSAREPVFYDYSPQKEVIIPVKSQADVTATSMYSENKKNDFERCRRDDSVWWLKGQNVPLRLFLRRRGEPGRFVDVHRSLWRLGSLRSSHVATQPSRSSCPVNGGVAARVTRRTPLSQILSPGGGGGSTQAGGSGHGLGEVGDNSAQWAPTPPRILSEVAEICSRL